MRNCPQCGYENQDIAKFCENCGAPLEVAETKVEPEAVEEPKTSAVEPEAETAKTTAKEQYVESTGSPYEGQNSPLSIIAFICSFILSLLGLVLGVIDLCIGDGRKKGLSIAAVVISVLKIAIVVFAIIIPVIFVLE